MFKQTTDLNNFRENKFQYAGIRPCPCYGEDGLKNSPSLIDALRALHPSQSIGQPADVAQLALLIDQQPSAFLNGCIINLDGGISNCLHDPF